jgi:four helix bundle protein
MRDYRRLQGFKMADSLAIEVYRITKHFPLNEQFGLTSQLRRAAVSVGANSVEGASREYRAEFARFLSIAYASAREMEFELRLAARLTASWPFWRAGSFSIAFDNPRLSDISNPCRTPDR